jgi:CheY-like chemotaxis protein
VIPVSCPVCGTAATLAENDTYRPCGQCQAEIYRPAPGPRVLVAHETAELRHALGETLCVAGYHVLAAASGGQVLELVRAHGPKAVVLDVGLTGMTTFQILEHLKAPSAPPIKAVLVASVFNKTAYKRRPTKLYGADDYLEQHHIRDMLAQKVGALVNFQPAVPAAAAAPIGDAGGPVRPDLRGKLRVRALAHSIVSDIALYHQGEFEAIVQGGDPAMLAAPLQEGRRLLDEMVGSDGKTSQDPVGEAFRAFIDEMRKAGT